MSYQLVPSRLPKVPIQRRAAAFLIDFVVVVLLSILLGGNTASGLLIFFLLWLAMRVLLAANNKGQSLGRWALDIKIVDSEYRKTPAMLDLAKREATTGFGIILVLMGLSSGFTNNFSLLLLAVPLAVDCGAALADTKDRQAIHDRIGQTLVVATERGFSLDLRLKKIFFQLSRRMR